MSFASPGTRQLTRAALLVLGLLLLALPASAPAAVTCGQTITQSTTLDADLQCDSNYGIVIGAPGITLNLGGHSVDAHSASILNEGHANVTIKNGTVVVDTVGIRLRGVTGNLVRNVVLEGLQDGIEVYDSDANRFVGNRFHSVWIRLQDGSDDNVIHDNTLLGYESLIMVNGAARTRVTDNVIRSGMETGVGLYRSNHSLVANNDMSVVLGGGVSLYQSHDNEVSSNVVHGAPSGSSPIDVFGIQVTDSHANLLRRNRFFDTTNAIDVISGWANELRRNEAYTGVKDGYLVEPGAVATTLLGNYVQNFDGDGIDAQAATTRLGDNSATANGGLGIRAVPGVTDLGGNTASGNGAGQCQNVFCP
jgi:parallel beta-helix repeat protein